MACPHVPACPRIADPVVTHGDLVRALIDTRDALARCTLYRDTLAACQSTDRIEKK